MFMHENTKLLSRKEVRLHTLLTFFAEVGGYLGMLVGGNVLLYITSASKWILHPKKKLKELKEKYRDGAAVVVGEGEAVVVGEGEAVVVGEGAAVVVGVVPEVSVPPQTETVIKDCVTKSLGTPDSQSS
jgi:hypothetical protein